MQKTNVKFSIRDTNKKLTYQISVSTGVMLYAIFQLLVKSLSRSILSRFYITFETKRRYQTSHSLHAYFGEHSPDKCSKFALYLCLQVTTMSLFSERLNNNQTQAPTHTSTSASRAKFIPARCIKLEVSSERYSTKDFANH